MKLHRRTFMLAAGLFVSGLTGSAALAADTLAIGAYPNNPPFEFKKADGSFEGFEVDIAVEAAKRAGLTPEIADYGFQALFAGTTSRRIDTAISTITITPERLKAQAFTQPYYDSALGVATKVGSSVKSLDDSKGKTVGALAGSTGDKWVKENQAKYGYSDIKTYNTQQDMFMDLNAGRIDIVISDIPGMQYLFLTQKGFEVIDRIKTGEQYGLMLADRKSVV